MALVKANKLQNKIKSERSRKGSGRRKKGSIGNQGEVKCLWR